MGNFLKTQSGFSLVQGMVIAAVLAGSALVATRLMTDQKLAQKGAETRDQVEQLHSLIYTVLQNKDHCNATVRALGAADGATDISSALAGQLNPTLENIRTLITASPTTTRVIFRKLPSGSDPNRTYMNNSVIIREMQFVYQVGPGNLPSPTPENPTPAVPSESIAYLHIDYERLNKTELGRTKTGYGAKNIRKTIVLRIQRYIDPVPPNPRLFQSCYALTENIPAADAGNVDLSKKMCEDLNLFVWSEELGTCLPKDLECDFGLIYTGVDSNGQLECRRLEDWVDMNSYIDYLPPGNGSHTACEPGMTAQFVLSGDKVRIICGP